MARTLYRIVRAAVPSWDDFRSAREKGRPLLDPALRREWSDAISTYDDPTYACAQAASFRFRMGAFLAVLEIPDEVECRQTGADRHHVSVYADAATLMALLKGETIACDRERLR